MSIVKTTEEFSSRRKVRYGGGDSTPPSKYPLTSSSVNASLSPHKSFYGRDSDGTEAYLIEFNIGDFNFDEISIRTEGRRLIVQGKSRVDRGKEELSREFTRDFTLPSNVDQYSIKAQLDEATRLLTLIGRVKQAVSNGAASNSGGDYLSTMNSLSLSSSSGSSDWVTQSTKIGSVHEARGHRTIDYEVYLGQELKDGSVNIEISGYNTLAIRVSKSDWDKYGDFAFELKRQIKLPPGTDSHNIEHGIDPRTACLFVKVPIK